MAELNPQEVKAKLPGEIEEIISNIAKVRSQLMEPAAAMAKEIDVPTVTEDVTATCNVLEKLISFLNKAVGEEGDSALDKTSFWSMHGAVVKIANTFGGNE